MLPPGLRWARRIVLLAFVALLFHSFAGDGDNVWMWPAVVVGFGILGYCYGWESGRSHGERL